MNKIAAPVVFRRAALVLAICLTAIGAAAQSAAVGSNEEAIPLHPVLVPTVQGELIKVATARQDVVLPVFWMPKEGATATIVLMSGGAGGMGKMVNGQPNSTNFLVRSREYFYNEGFNIAVVGRSSDKSDWSPAYRTTDEHMGDLKKVVAAVKELSPLPVWMVGTSMGTISTAAAAIYFGNDQLAGIVLTSSITGRKIRGAVPSQDLDRIRIPVLVMHSESDSCNICQPFELKYIMRGLDNAPIKKQILVSPGNEAPTGDPCMQWANHGFIGVEKEAVATIANWIISPTN